MGINPSVYDDALPYLACDCVKRRKREKEEMATKLGMKRTAPQLPLKRKTPLRAKKGLNKMSDRTKKELKVWRQVTLERQEKLMAEFCFIPCEYCHQMIQSGSDLFHAEGHHNNSDRRDNSPENCRVLHKTCNQLVSDKNIRDVPSLL